MTKFAIISDLHLEFQKGAEPFEFIRMINQTDADCVLNAGDLHPSADVRNFFMSGIRKPHFFVMGNHDYYGSALADDHWCKKAPGGLKVVGCTLWTNFNNEDPLTMMYYKGCLSDAHFIKPLATKSNTLEEQMINIHNFHLDYIAKKKPDIVVTHHSPSLLSLHEEYKHNFPMNWFFHSDLDKFILNNDNIKLWVHGHTHAAADYRLGNTRIVCHPLGYPHERQLNNYFPKVIEIDV